MNASGTVLIKIRQIPSQIRACVEAAKRACSAMSQANLRILQLNTMKSRAGMEALINDPAIQDLDILLNQEPPLSVRARLDNSLQRNWLAPLLDLCVEHQSGRAHFIDDCTSSNTFDIQVCPGKAEFSGLERDPSRQMFGPRAPKPRLRPCWMFRLPRRRPVCRAVRGW